MTKKELARRKIQNAGRGQRVAARRGMHYLSRLPACVPPDRVLVHNHVVSAGRLGTRGFRAWLSAPDPSRLVACACGWATGLATHFTTALSPWK